MLVRFTMNLESGSSERISEFSSAYTNPTSPTDIFLESESALDDIVLTFVSEDDRDEVMDMLFNNDKVDLRDYFELHNATADFMFKCTKIDDDDSYFPFNVDINDIFPDID